MADYKLALSKLLPKEGLYDNDKDDPGGETVWGITRRDHPSDAVWVIVDAHKSNPEFPKILSGLVNLNEAVEAHYKPSYWDKVRGDEIISQAVAEELFDTAVNCGIGTAIKILQKLLNVGNRNTSDYADTEEDGVFRDSDLADLGLLASRRGESAIVKGLNILQGARYYEICKSNPKMEKYWWGWIVNRA